MLKSKHLLAPAALLLVAMTFGFAAQTAQASPKSAAEAEADSMLAAITGTPAKLGRQSNIPAILSETDEQLYRAAFQAQDRGQMTYADRMIEKIHDPILLGPLLAHRYLSDSYHPQGPELKDWLSKYSDQAQADAIYQLARQRGIAASSLKTPSISRPTVPSSGSRDDTAMLSGDFIYESTRSAADRRRLDPAKDKFRDKLSDEAFDQAAAMLDGPELRRVFDKIDYDEMKTSLAQALFANGRDEEALRWSREAAERSGDLLPEANWVVGLILWRMNQHADAARYFEAAANGSHAAPWLNAAGAYWAARANLAAQKPEVVNHWLLEAAASPRTFYGFLARRALGQEMQYSWDSRPFTDLDGETLSRVPATRRALALIQVGVRDGAEDELRALVPQASPALAQSMLSLSGAADIPGLTVDLGGVVAAQDGRSHDSAAYPVPDWHPSSGWNIDRALMLAIARQESDLNPHAHSPSGAVGLMQLMPRTAKTVGAGKLTDPSVNLELGQRYIRRLLDDTAVKGNLLFLAASYNSGPGNLARWQQAMHHNGDALLFLESIPVRETRHFVQRVLTNYWTYRNRLGQDAPSLDAIAAGNWPTYDGAGVSLRQVKN
jgi:soluble lytic murein transglycosylase-like protein